MKDRKKIAMPAAMYSAKKMPVTRMLKVLAVIAVVCGILIGIGVSGSVYEEKSCLATYGVSREELHEKTALITAAEAVRYKASIKKAFLMTDQYINDGSIY